MKPTACVTSRTVTHVAISGTFVQEKNHKKWNEIHPVSRIQAQ